MDGLYFGYPDGSSYEFDGKLLRSKLTLEYLEDCANYIRISLPQEAELSLECGINASLLEKLLYSVDLSLNKDISNVSLILSQPYQEQIRRHRKKRINKKWAKRYGFRTKFKQIVIDGVEIVKSDIEEIDILGRRNTCLKL